MDLLPVAREDLPEDIQQEIKRLFGGKIFHNFGLYGPKKYCLRDVHYKTLSPLMPHVNLRPDDVWICGYQRSGTHWLAEMTWLINNNLNLDTAYKVNHQDRIKIFETPYFGENIWKPPTLKTYDQMPLRRFFKTHLPLSMLPPNLLETSKIVYVARDPRDAFLSHYHLLCRWDLANFRGSIEEAAELFFKDFWYCSPYFENILEYWNLRYHRNILFLFYENVVKDLPSVVRRISKFFDKEFTESQYEQLCEHLQFNNMKGNKSFNTDSFFKQDIQLISKGKIGGWREEFTEDLKKRFETWMADNLKFTDLSFPSNS